MLLVKNSHKIYLEKNAIIKHFYEIIKDILLNANGITGGVKMKKEGFESISNELLLESYYKATQLHLDIDFITLLYEEMKKRKLDIQALSTQIDGKE